MRRSIKWVPVLDLSQGAVIRSSSGNFCVVKHIELINEPVELYCIYVKDAHNFCISSFDINVHNFAPVMIAAIMWSFGLGSIELASIGLGFAAGGTFIGYSLYKKQQHANQGNIIGVHSVGAPMFPEDPDDDEEDLKEKKRQRDEIRSEHRPLTNKEAREQAKKMGYKEEKDHPVVVPTGTLVFKKGRTYISPDRTGHKGGVWKMFNKVGARISTWNLDLTKVIGQ